MRWFAIIIVACLALTVLRTAIVVLVAAVGLSVLWGVFFRPAETFGLLLLLAFISLLNLYPLAVLSLIGFLGFIVLMRRPASEDELAPIVEGSRPIDEATVRSAERPQANDSA
jgi:hypothetical protein